MKSYAEFKARKRALREQAQRQEAQLTEKMSYLRTHYPGILLAQIFPGQSGGLLLKLADLALTLLWKPLSDKVQDLFESWSARLMEWISQKTGRHKESDA